MIRQTIFGVDKEAGVYGNCFQACVAMVTGKVLDEVPHFYRDGGSQFREIREWFKNHGLFLIEFTLLEGRLCDVLAEQFSGAACIVTGPSPRGDWAHAVVGRVTESGEIVLSLDPHPSDAFFCGPATHVEIICGPPLRGDA